MTAGWNHFCLNVGDALWGWSLTLPRDATLLLLVGVSVVLMLAVRRLTAPLTLLRQVSDDERRLRELIATAKQNADSEAITRHRRVRAQVAGVRFRAEVLPALISFLPLAVLLTWAGARLEFLPTQVDTTFVFTARLPASSIGELVHLVPAEGLQVERNWIREIQSGSDAEGAYGVAEWSLRVDASSEAYALRVRFRGATLLHRVIVGHRTHLPSRVDHDGNGRTQVGLTEYRPLRFVPGWSWAGIPPWVVGYLALALPLFLWGKRLMRLG